MTSKPSEASSNAVVLPKGRWVPLSLPRRWVCDLLYFAKQIPTVPVQRRIEIGPLVEARSRLANRPSWLAIFTRAYGLVAKETPELRRAYLKIPWPHLYESGFSIASVAVEREFRGEKAVFFAHLRSPETQSIAELDRHMRRFREEPIEGYGLFRRSVDIATLPLPIRFWCWWYAMNVGGAKRAKRLGTFGVTVYSGLGSESLHPMSPLTTTLNWGVIENGSVVVRVIYDHRVMDGSTVARAQARLEEVLNNEIVKELSTHNAKAA
jgi:hypothetical protein